MRAELKAKREWAKSIGEPYDPHSCVPLSVMEM
jgi:hypothetical protein